MTSLMTSKLDNLWRHCDVTVTSLWQEWVSGNSQRPGYDTTPIAPYVSDHLGSRSNETLKKCYLFWPKFNILWRHCDVTKCHGPMGVGEFHLPMSKLWYHTNITLHQWSGGLPQPLKGEKWCHFPSILPIYDVIVTSLTVMDRWDWVRSTCQCPSYHNTPTVYFTCHQVTIHSLKTVKTCYFGPTTDDVIVTSLTMVDQPKLVRPIRPCPSYDTIPTSALNSE